MKKLLLLAVMACVGINAWSQDIYKEVLKMSQDVANNTSKSIEVRKVATFKVDACEYMAAKMLELMPDSSVEILDNQAIALYNFVHLYTTKLGRTTSDKEQKKLSKIFTDASLKNCRFNDPDHDLTLAYCRGDRYITKFSLDTDWVKAYAMVRKELGLE